ncbi:hypothetical protein C4K03_2365 [Pseudomonas synxantha]|uniref:Uncharacterized protein n=1 Tax=Pseudomonas synxantha TaxID=47883 RepID=A0A3G7U5F5_9PSED|nr:hypothetical protein C4K03_2365 [Pseudomonas synxantha]
MHAKYFAVFILNVGKNTDGGHDENSSLSLCIILLAPAIQSP